MRRELPHVWAPLANPKVRWRLCASAAFISINWIAYVCGIASHRVVETSLGYFINPRFSLIWTALAIYAIDGVWRSRKAAVGVD